MKEKSLVDHWIKLCENGSRKHPLENASSRELIPYVGEEIKKLKEALEKCLKDVAYKFENSKSHPEMMEKYKKIRKTIDDAKKKLVDDIHKIVG